MNLWDSNHSNQTLSLFLSFFLSQISEELEWNCIYPLKERKMLIMENWRDIIDKTRQLSRFWEENFNIRCEVEPNNSHKAHTQLATVEKWICVCAWVGCVWAKGVCDEKYACETKREIAKEQNEISKSYPTLHMWPHPHIQINIRQ